MDNYSKQRVFLAMSSTKKHHFRQRREHIDAKSKHLVSVGEGHYLVTEKDIGCAEETVQIKENNKRLTQEKAGRVIVPKTDHRFM